MSAKEKKFRGNKNTWLNLFGPFFGPNKFNHVYIS